MPNVAVPQRISGGLARVGKALHLPRYRILWFGTLFSFLGMQMQIIARGYLAYDLTGRNTALGGVMIAFGVPQMLFALWGGVVADRMAKRNVLILWQSSLAVGSALLTLAIWSGAVQYWMLLAMAVLTGTAFSFIGPARQAFIGDLVPEELMGNATVLQQASMNGTRVIGPALAGTIIAIPVIGVGGVYALTTLGFVITAATLFLLPPGRPKRKVEHSSPLQDVVDSLRYVRRDRPIATLLLTSFIVVALAFPYTGFLPSVARSVFGRGALGLGAMSALAAVGALAATLAAATLTAHKRAWRLQTFTGVAFAVTLVVFAFAPSFPMALLAILFVGFFASGFQSLNSALTMTLAEKHYYGRVQALMGLNWSLFGILSLPFGVLADAIGIRTTLALMGMATLVCLAGIQFLARMLGVEREVRVRTTELRREPWERWAVPLPVAPGDGTGPVTAGESRR